MLSPPHHLRGSEIYARHVVVMMQIVHLLLGFRELRDARYYHDDVIVKRLLRFKRLPTVSAASRALSATVLHAQKRAAQEPNVTPSAISHQVRALEDFLVVRLFRRSICRVQMSTRVQAYVVAIRAALDQIGCATR